MLYTFYNYQFSVSLYFTYSPLHIALLLEDDMIFRFYMMPIDGVADLVGKLASMKKI